MAVPPSHNREAWGAQLHVRPLPGQSGGLGGAAGAYAWVFALAADETEYRSLAAAEMERLGLYVAEIEHLDRCDPQEADSDEAATCLERLSDQFPVQYQRFHTYPRDEG